MNHPMFTYDARMTELVLDFCRRRLALDPVPLDYGGLEPPRQGALDGLITEEGRDAEEVLGIFVDELSTSILSTDCSRYMAFIPSAPSKASLLFDMIVSSAAYPATSWFEAAGVVVAENQALRCLADLAGLPDSSGGCFVAGGSAGNLSALVVARETAAARGGAAMHRARVAVSEEAHASVQLALRVVGMEALVVPVADHRLTGAELATALASNPASHDVVAVVGTAGTTNGGIVDDLAGIGAVAAEHRLWFHVDGAYGGAALLSPGKRGLFEGISLADSLVIDPHKWLFAPYDCAALIYRDPRLASDVFTQHASYLGVMHEEDQAAEAWNPGDFAFHLTRRARGLPFWFSLAVNGLAAYRDAVERALETARQAAVLIDEAPHLELIRPPELSVVLFRRPGWDAAGYRAWSSELLRSQRALVTPSAWEGEAAARFAFLHPDTSIDLVREIVDSMA